MKDAHLQIAYVGQPKSHHTLNELCKHYSKQGSSYLINCPLPINYYSYWKIENIDIETITQMQYFNHIFYLSFNKGISSYESFKSISDVILSLSGGISSDCSVFESSVFRDLTIKYIVEEFSLFIEKFVFLLLNNSYFNLIDIKYLPENYFLDSKNIEAIKNRSIRKQFVYEYLIEKNIENDNNIFNKSKIISDFWLPHCGQTSLIEDGKPFMGGYIGLKNIDFIKLAENYCSQDFLSIQNQFLIYDIPL